MLSLVGPAAVVSLFVLWLFLILLGLALVIWWNSGVDFADAMGISGSSLLTLGIATAPGAGPRTLEIVAAGLGFGIIALEIAYLPALYSAFATRETEVTLLAARAGTPAWGPEILARHFWLDTMDELPPLYSDWERWASAVSESHANYPGLMWFRSPVSTRSWLVALVAMMDSAAMYHSVSPGRTPRQARLCLSMGISCMRSMARALRIPYDDRSAPHVGHPAHARRNSKTAFAGSKRSTFPWSANWTSRGGNFQGWRINYEPIVDALTRLIAPPPAPWFVARPELGEAEWPIVLNRTPDEPEGAQGFGVSKTFKTPSARESNNS